MALYVTLALCLAFAGLLVYRYDVYEREPWCMVVLTTTLSTAISW